MSKTILIALFFLAGFSSPSSAQPEAEPNNSLQQANLISLGGTVTGYTQVASDTDCYKIRVNRGGVLEIVMAPSSSATGYWLDIVDSVQGLAQWVNTSFPGSGYTLRMLVSPGTYYFVQSPFLVSASSPVPYTITTKLDTSDRYEINNTTQTATLLPEFIRLRAKIDGQNRLFPPLGGDWDYYRINTIRPGILSARVHPHSTGIGFKIELYPYAANPPYDNVVAASATTSVSMEKRADLGAYFFQVNREFGNLSSDSFYTFEFSLDTNNAFGNAHRLAACDSILASTRLSTDTDYYALTGINGSVNVTASGIPAGVTVRLISYNNNQQQLALVTSTTSTVSLAVPTTAGSNYFIRVIETNGQGVFEEYRLKTSATNCGALDVAQDEALREISVYPNPVTDGRLFVEVPSLKGQAFAELYQLSGQLVMRERIATGTNLLTVTCAPGVYYLKTLAGAESRVSKVVVY